MNPTTDPLPWSLIQRFSFRFFFIFTGMFILTLSFPHEHIPDLPGMIAPLFERIAKWLGDEVFNINRPYSNQIISDSTGLYIHLFVLAVIAAVGAFVWGLLDKKRTGYSSLAYWFRVAISYYLAFYFLVYGFNKIFKWQFYLPEPNTLFTTMGDTWRDLLYWSTMGTSHSYNVFLGVLEVFAALLLLFRKTRLIGALVSISILVNVVMVNFSFDINVKIYSLFLLLISILIVVPDGKRLYSFFIRQRNPAPAAWQPAWTNPLHRKIYFILKPLVIAYIFWSALTGYIRSGNFNDDKAARPPFHGAYDIPIFIRNGDTILPITTDSVRWQRVFVHRRGYLIIQSMNDQMQDFLFESDTISHKWKIRHEISGGEAVLDYDQLNDSTINLSGRVGDDTLNLQLKKIDLSKLRVMRREFNWTVD